MRRIAIESSGDRDGRNGAHGGAVPDLVVLDAEPGAFAFASWKNLFVAVWKTHATAESVARLERASDAMTAAVPGPRSSVHVILEGAGLPTPEARAGFVSLMNRKKDSLALVAVVIEGTGFWSGALRSAMTGLRLLTPLSFRFRLMGTTEDLVKSLPAIHEHTTGVRIDPDELRALLLAAPSAANGDERTEKRP